MKRKFKDLQVSSSKMTLPGKSPEEFSQEVCEMTFLGKSNIPLSRLYLSEHSPIRTQIFWVVMENIPLYISTHLIRHHVGSIPFQLTCRDDRNGGNVHLREKLATFANNCIANGVSESEIDRLYGTIDRYTPVNLGLLINAQALIDMAKLRRCKQSHSETRYVFDRIVESIEKSDPSLAPLLVPKCVYRGGLCGEPNACGWNKTSGFRKQLNKYLKQFKKTQLPVYFYETEKGDIQ